MHESDQVMRQLGFRQTILLPPKNIRSLHKVNLRGRTGEDWLKFHKEYINIWEYKYHFSLIREPFLTLEFVIAPEYMSWFRHHNKLYLLLEEVMGRQHCMRRPQRPHRNPRYVFCTTFVASVSHANAYDKTDILATFDNFTILSAIEKRATFGLSAIVDGRAFASDWRPARWRLLGAPIRHGGFEREGKGCQNITVLKGSERPQNDVVLGANPISI
ncbi:hypothetical protein J1N35_007337 [Gossypium stocksii]|uniref:Aminotransferase-like plant mobile domain-containing protein n=1 Tax=Gossypium stocksii TaxID=47602 RepID=A0A9D3W6A2_9ROSI|nr:hypothetical protein J1N35_007337 [Gossypium stocksii]